MNHILLPGKPDLRAHDGSARYGVNAMELLIGRMQKEGGRRKNLVAKVFGGANVLDGLEKSFSPGIRNSTFAMDFLEMENIPVTGHDLGGYNARRIYLRTDTGEVFMKRIPRYQASQVVFEEKEYGRRVREEMKKPARVRLFRKYAVYPRPPPRNGEGGYFSLCLSKLFMSSPNRRGVKCR